MTSLSFWVTLATPAPVSALQATNKWLAVGSADGVVRLYHSSALEDCVPKVTKAIRGLPEEISSIIITLLKASEGEEDTLWIAAGLKIFRFTVSLKSKLIIGLEDADECIELEYTEADDAINQIAINSNQTCLALSLDSGRVGLVDIASRPSGSGNRGVRLLKGSHNNICYSLSFVPDRPRERGYDYKLLLQDFLLDTTLSSLDLTTIISANDSSEQVSLAPPFIQCMDVSRTRCIAAGTADGRLFVGLGGKKVEGKGKQKRWEGLSTIDGKGFLSDIAEGPIVAVGWLNDSKILTVTLGGTFKVFSVAEHLCETVVVDGNAEGAKPASDASKVNTMAPLGNSQVAVGGLTGSGKGFVNIYFIKHQGDPVP